MRRFLFSLCAVGALALGCGGGGGGGGGSDGGVAYTGPTTPATVTEANAVDLSETSVSGGELADLGNVLSREARGISGLGTPGPGPIAMARFFERLGETVLSARRGPRTAAEVHEEGGSQPGSCPGA